MCKSCSRASAPATDVQATLVRATSTPLWALETASRLAHTTSEPCLYSSNVQLTPFTELSRVYRTAPRFLHFNSRPHPPSYLSSNRADRAHPPLTLPLVSNNTHTQLPGGVPRGIFPSLQLCRRPRGVVRCRHENNRHPAPCLQSRLLAK